MKERDISIDILKFIAAIVITNSHMELLYGKYSLLATGGAIGDVLFFFSSGFTLFLGCVERFDNLIAADQMYHSYHFEMYRL